MQAKMEAVMLETMQKKKIIEQQRPSEGGAWKSIEIVSKSAAYLDI